MKSKIKLEHPFPWVLGCKKRSDIEEVDVYGVLSVFCI